MVRRTDFAVCASLVLMALVVAGPLWGPGMVNTRGGGDSPFLLQRTHQMLVNLRAGIFPVRWMPDAAYGLGYPFFSYYSALPYYMAGLLALLGLDLLSALKLVQTLGFALAALAMYGWMRRVNRRSCAQSRWAAWLAAVAYTVAPFHLVNVYVRGDSLSEFYAFVFYPLILWALDGIRGSALEAEDVGPRSVVFNMPFAATALAYAGLILTHNISAFIFSPFVLLYLIVLAVRTPASWRYVLIAGFLALAFGLALSAWVSLPTLVERSAVQTETLTGGYFHHAHHFRTTDLVQTHPLFNYSTVEGDTPFAMGLIQAACAALGMAVLVVRGVRGRLQNRWGFVLLGLLVSTAMITPLSEFLWDRVALLATTQFPWRFLSVQALFAAATTTALVSDVAIPERRSQRSVPRPGWIAVPVAALLVLAVLLPLHPERLAVGPADVTPERLRLYELFTQNIGTSIGYEWLPRAAVPRPFTSDALIEPVRFPRSIPLGGASLEASLVEQRPTQQVWRVWGEGGSVAFSLLYWPGWTARVDGQPVAVWPVEGSGYLALEVPPGEHTVTVRLGRTPVRTVGEIISLGAWIVLGVASFLRWLRVRPRVRWLSVSGYVSLIVLPALALLLLPRGAFGDGNELVGNLTMDFDQMPYLHHNPGGVHFGDGELTGYRLSAEELAPGDVLTVTLDWVGAVDAYTATVRVVSPAAVRQELEPLAVASCRLRSGIPNAVTLPLPEGMSRGTYLLQLDVLGPARDSDSIVSYRALTPGGRMCGPLYLRPIRVPRGPSLPADASVLAPFGPAIRLHGATVTQLDADRLAVRLTWSATRPVATNYGISLRLLDADGQGRVSLDTQPGYGFLPTSLWRPGELIVDPYVLDLPDDLPLREGYHVVVILYQVSTWEPIGQVRLGDFAFPLGGTFEARRPPRTFLLPSLQPALRVDFGAQVRLAGYGLEQESDALRLALWWQALQAPAADYTVFVHLFDPDTEAIVAQSDSTPQAGAYPTSWWAEGEVVSETVTLPLEGVPEGSYWLAVGLYDRTVARLRAVDADAKPLPDGRFVLPESVEIGPQQ